MNKHPWKNLHNIGIKLERLVYISSSEVKISGLECEKKKSSQFYLFTRSFYDLFSTGHQPLYEIFFKKPPGKNAM